MQEHLDETNQKIAEFPHIKDKIKLSRQMSIYSIKFYTYLYNGDKINARKYFEKEGVLSHTVNKVDIEYRKYYLNGLHGKK